jgi:hypothetical protein
MIGRALVDVTTPDLERALRGVHRGDLPCPVDVVGLTRNGLQHCAQHFTHHLRGLDKRAVQAVLVAVIAERKAPKGPAIA